MRIMYGLLIAIEIILMGICSYKAMNKKGRLAKIVFIYEAVAAAADGAMAATQAGLILER